MRARTLLACIDCHRGSDALNPRRTKLTFPSSQLFADLLLSVLLLVRNYLAVVYYGASIMAVRRPWRGG